MSAPRFSVVVPVSDRSGDPASLLEAIERGRAGLEGEAEILFVFDGHRGREAAALRERGAGRPGLRVVELHQRMGESAVLAAGLREARGSVLFRVPPYLQVDLGCLPALAREVASGIDCALVERIDTAGRPSGGQRRLLNRLISRVARAEIRDVGCLVCAFTAEVARALPPQGDLHRYLPVLVAVEGFSTVHVPAPAVSGPGSGERRSVRSYAARFMDFMAVLFLARSMGSPLRFFGLLGLAPLLAGIALTLWLVWERLFQGQPLAERPLLLLGLLLVTAGVQAAAIGFLGELMVYLHYRDRQPDRARPLAADPRRDDAGPDRDDCTTGDPESHHRPARGLRVVMVAPTPFFSDRGCHVRILEEARGLMRLGAAVTICTYFLGDTPAGLDVRRAASMPGYAKRSAGPSWGKPLLDLLLLRLVRRVVRERRPQVIHAHLHEGIAVALRAGGEAVRVLDVQGGLADETLDHGFLPDRPPVRRALEAVEGRLDRAADFVITSHGDAARMLRERWNVPDERVHVVGDGGTLPPADPSRTARYRARFELAPGEPVLLYAGLLGEHQGTGHLFAVGEALRESGRGRLLVLGYPEARWREEAERRGLDRWMIFAGRFPYEDFSSLLALGEVGLSPKTSLTEGNQKLYAYLQAGLPVVAFDTPATAEVLADAGILVPAGDGRALAGEALALAADPDRREALAGAGRRRAEDLGGWDEVAARILDAYGAAGARWYFDPEAP